MKTSASKNPHTHTQTHTLKTDPTQTSLPFATAKETVQNPRRKGTQTLPQLTPPTTGALAKSHTLQISNSLLMEQKHTCTHLLPACCPLSVHSDWSCWRFVHFSAKTKTDTERKDILSQENL